MHKQDQHSPEKEFLVCVRVDNSSVSLFKLTLTHIQASSRTFDMIEKREIVSSTPTSSGQTIWSG